MKTKKWLLFAAFVAVSFLVVACGGGGSSATPQPPPVSVPAPVATTLPSATGSVTAVSGCTIVEDASTCGATVSYTTANNPAAPDLKIGTVSVASAPWVTNFSVTIGEGTFPVTLYDGTTVLDNSKTVTGVCDTDTAWDGTKCTRVVLHYRNITVGIANYFGVIDGTGFHPSTNKSPYTFGALPVSSCLLPEDKLPDGRIPILCYVVQDNLFHVLVLDPITNSYTAYNKPMPAGYEYLADSSSGVLFGPKWHECQYSGCLYGGAWGTPPFPFMVSWAPDGKGGYYFVSDTIPGTIVTNGNVYERDAAGTITLVWKVPLVIGVSSVSAMETFSN